MFDFKYVYVELFKMYIKVLFNELYRDKVYYIGLFIFLMDF